MLARGASTPDRADEVERRILAFLDAQGAARLPHARGRSLLDHLQETAAIVHRWRQPAWLAHAALIHSVYGTEAYRPRLLDATRRADMAALAGARAERLAHLYSVTAPGSLLESTEDGGEADATPEERDCLRLLHMANLAEQRAAEDGSPGPWLVALRDLAESLIASDVVELPLFVAELAALTAADESLARQAYGAGVGRAVDIAARLSHLGLAAAVCPVVAEPCVWLAHLAAGAGDREAARTWAAHARMRLHGLGTAWDKRLRFDEWDRLARAIEGGAGGRIESEFSDPRALLDAVTGTVPEPSRRRSPGRLGGRARFHRYVEALGDGVAPAMGGVYPDLPARPWHDPEDFPLARYLEAHHEAVCSEVLALAPVSFQPESERIGRSGEWDVAFFYERGRRHDDLCRACPVTARGIDGYGALRTVVGLVYVSRMRPGTHIAAHRGPTNLRLRCHLGVQVPDGDCAIRVGHETRRWRPGRCLVFDDHFEHEAWNHTDAERIVLIVDLWNPGLSDDEVRLLEGLHRHTYAQARSLCRYWSVNAAAARPRGA